MLHPHAGPLYIGLHIFVGGKVTCWLMFDMLAINMFFLTQLYCPVFGVPLQQDNNCTIYLFAVFIGSIQSTMNAPLASKGLRQLHIGIIYMRDGSGCGDGNSTKNSEGR